MNIDTKEKELINDLLDIVKRTYFIFSNEANYPEGTIGYKISQDAKAAIQKATEQKEIA